MSKATDEMHAEQQKQVFATQEAERKRRADVAERNTANRAHVPGDAERTALWHEQEAARIRAQEAADKAASEAADGTAVQRRQKAAMPGINVPPGPVTTVEQPEAVEPAHDGPKHAKRGH